MGERKPEQRKVITHGRGAIILISPARNAVSPTTPNLAYIWAENNGLAPTNIERTKLKAATDDAAIGRYAATKNINSHTRM